jgi:hypothetical protein
MLRAAAFAALLSLPLLALADDAPKAITDAINALEKAHADAKTPADKEKLADAVAALKKIAEAKKPANHLISDFIDNRANYAGRTLTFRLAYTGGTPLNQLKPGAQATFTGEDPKNGAKLRLNATIPPKGINIKLPAAKDGEEVILTFSMADKGVVFVEGAVRP